MLNNTYNYTYAYVYMYNFYFNFEPLLTILVNNTKLYTK